MNHQLSVCSEDLDVGKNSQLAYRSVAALRKGLSIFGGFRYLLALVRILIHRPVGGRCVSERMSAWLRPRSLIDFRHYGISLLDVDGP